MNFLRGRILIGMTLWILIGGITGCAKEEKMVPATKGEESLIEEITNLNLWYTDSNQTEFLEESIREFEKINSVTVTPKLVSLVDYVEKLNEASISGDKVPDVFIGSSSILEKVKLAGLALENNQYQEIYKEENYPSTALHAATYKDKLYGYPLTFETSFLLYNKNYSEQAPATFDEILSFAETFEVPEGEEVGSILKWNVADIFNDYFFVGNYAQIGGDTGDNRSLFDIHNQQLIDSLTYYQNLNQFFFIDPKLVTYENILQEFMEGKTVFTIVKTDALSVLEEAIAAGTSSVNYGVGELPDLTLELQTKGLSQTDLLIVNGYTKAPEKAKELAKFLSFDQAHKLYEKTGEFSTRLGIAYENPEVAMVISQYENSVEVPKLMESGNYWVKMEIAFSNIWAGNDVGSEIQAVSEFMGKQLE